MDIDISSNGGNASSTNMYAPKRRVMKGYGNFANSNSKAVGVQKNTAKKKKKRPLTYKQNMG
jgi:hypothetical protein